MVTLAAQSGCASTVYTEWRALLIACESYAQARAGGIEPGELTHKSFLARIACLRELFSSVQLCGWRFVLSDFMCFDQRQEKSDLRIAQEKAMPMALEYADRLHACGAAHAAGAEPPRLLAEFEAAQRFVALQALGESNCALVANPVAGERKKLERIISQ